jgi:hypothetical protein
MRRWEYAVKRLDLDTEPQALAEALSTSGEDGWELVTVVQVGGVHGLAFLKRAAD